MRILNLGRWNRPPKGNPLWGFTLIEVMITLFIISMLVGLVVPNLRMNDQESIRLAALRLRSVLHWLQEQSTYTGEEYRLHMDFAKQRYWCELRNGEIFVPVTDPLLRMEVLNPSQGRMVWVPYDNGIADADEVLVPFSTFGPDRPIMVRFVGEEEGGYTVFLRPEWWAPRMAEGILAWDSPAVQR